MGNSAGPKITKDGLVLDFDAANYKSYPAGQDPYVSGVNLLFDGESLVDKSAKTQSFTNNSSVAVSTTQKKFGNSSLYFSGRTADGGSNSYLSFAANSNFGFGSGNWTVETWFYKTTPLASLDVLFDNRVGVGTNVSGVALYVQAGVVKTGNNAERLAGATIATGVWNHLMISRSGNNIYLGVNGTVVSAAFSTTLHSAPQLYIGNSVIGEYAGGYMDDYRVTKGFARYTTNYTIPTLPNVLTGTVTDLTKNKNVGTLTNGVDYNFSNGGSLAFVTSYVSSPSAASYQLGANNFTFESWIYLNAYPLASNGVYTAMIMCKDQLGSRGFNFSITGSSSANTALLFGGFSSNSVSQNAAPAYPFQLNTWYHVTASRVGNLLYMYVNGNLLNAGGTSFTTTIQSTTSEVRIAAQVYSGGYNYYVNGRIAIMKLYNGRGLTSGEVYNNFVANRGRFGV